MRKFDETIENLIEIEGKIYFYSQLRNILSSCSPIFPLDSIFPYEKRHDSPTAIINKETCLQDFLEIRNKLH